MRLLPVLPLWLGLCWAVPGCAPEGEDGPPASPAHERLAQDSEEEPFVAGFSSSHAMNVFVHIPPEKGLVTSSPVARAEWFLKEHGPALGIEEGELQFVGTDVDIDPEQVLATGLSEDLVRFHRVFAGVPMFGNGAEIVVAPNGAITVARLAAPVLPPTTTKPLVSLQQAEEQVLRAHGVNASVVGSGTELVIIAEESLGLSRPRGEPLPTRLVWKVVAHTGIESHTRFVDALDGQLLAQQLSSGAGAILLGVSHNQYDSTTGAQILETVQAEGAGHYTVDCTGTACNTTQTRVSTPAPNSIYLAGDAERQTQIDTLTGIVESNFQYYLSRGFVRAGLDERGRRLNIFLDMAYLENEVARMTSNLSSDHPAAALTPYLLVNGAVHITGPIISHELHHLLFDNRTRFAIPRTGWPAAMAEAYADVFAYFVTGNPAFADLRTVELKVTFSRAEEATSIYDKSRPFSHFAYALEHGLGTGGAAVDKLVVERLFYHSLGWIRSRHSGPIDFGASMLGTARKLYGGEASCNDLVDKIYTTLTDYLELSRCSAEQAEDCLPAPPRCR